MPSTTAAVDINIYASSSQDARRPQILKPRILGGPKGSIGTLKTGSGSVSIMKINSSGGNKIKGGIPAKLAEF